MIRQTFNLDVPSRIVTFIVCCCCRGSLNFPKVVLRLLKLYRPFSEMPLIDTKISLLQKLLCRLSSEDLIFIRLLNDEAINLLNTQRTTVSANGTL